MAGLFYPADPASLRETVRELLRGASAPGFCRPKALIAPHAGYVYSGPVAASAYKTLMGRAGKVTRVVLIGPSHRVAFSGLGLSSADAFATPLGAVPLDREARAQALRLPRTAVQDAAHAGEHGLEVHLPFLQEVLRDFSIVPVVVGSAHPHEVAEALETLWGGDETLAVVSTDLSHYLGYDAAVECDSRTADAILNLDPDGIGADDACGAVPVRGLLGFARIRGLRVTGLDLRNSGDTAGGRSRVVGYGAWALEG